MTISIYKTKFKVILTLITIILYVSKSFAQENTIGVTDVTWDVTEGFTIFSSGPKTFIINNCGQVIKEWESENRVSNSAYLLDNGNLLRTGNPKDFGYAYGGVIEEFNWEGELIWSFQIDNDDYIQHHDIEPLANGNILVLCYNFKEPIDAWNSGAMDTLEYWSTSVFEIEPVGTDQANIVWEWHLWDHLFQNIDSTRLNHSTLDHPELFDINEMLFPNDSTLINSYSNIGPDWMHMNSIAYNEERKEILLSSRDHNEIFILDHSTSTEEAATHSGGVHDMGGDFIYRFGRTEFYGQHDAHWISRPDFHENAIMVFNNGHRFDDQSRHYSSVDMLIPKIDANDMYVHNEVDTFQVLLKLDNPDAEYSSIMGSAQALGNDRFLVNNSQRGWFLEFDSSRNLKWKYVNTLGFSGPHTQGDILAGGFLIFRAKRLALHHPAFQNNWNIGDPIELEFDIDTCLNITIVDEMEENEIFKIYPNPTSTYMYIETNQTFRKISFYNTIGQLFVPSEIEVNKWDIQNIPNGFYFVVLLNEVGIEFTNKVIIQH